MWLRGRPDRRRRGCVGRRPSRGVPRRGGRVDRRLVVRPDDDGAGLRDLARLVRAGGGRTLRLPAHRHQLGSPRLGRGDAVDRGGRGVARDPVRGHLQRWDGWIERRVDPLGCGTFRHLRACRRDPGPHRLPIVGRLPGPGASRFRFDGVLELDRAPRGRPRRLRRRARGGPRCCERVRAPRRRRWRRCGSDDRRRAAAVRCTEFGGVVPTGTPPRPTPGPRRPEPTHPPRRQRDHDSPVGDRLRPDEEILVDGSDSPSNPVEPSTIASKRRSTRRARRASWS